MHFNPLLSKRPNPALDTDPSVDIVEEVADSSSIPTPPVALTAPATSSDSEGNSNSNSNTENSSDVVVTPIGQGQENTVTESVQEEVSSISSNSLTKAIPTAPTSSSTTDPSSNSWRLPTDGLSMLLAAASPKTHQSPTLARIEKSRRPPSPIGAALKYGPSRSFHNVSVAANSTLVLKVARTAQDYPINSNGRNGIGYNTNTPLLGAAKGHSTDANTGANGLGDGSSKGKDATQQHLSWVEDVMNAAREKQSTTGGLPPVPMKERYYPQAEPVKIPKIRGNKSKSGTGRVPVHMFGWIGAMFAWGMGLFSQQS